LIAANIDDLDTFCSDVIVPDMKRRLQLQNDELNFWQLWTDSASARMVTYAAQVASHEAASEHLRQVHKMQLDRIQLEEIGDDDSEFYQYKQTVEKYEKRKNKTSRLSDCKFIQIALEDTVLLPTLAQADHICETEKYLAKNNNLLTEFNKQTDRYNCKITILKTINDHREAFFELLQRPIQGCYYRFKGPIAIDAGGVSRQVFTMAGKYIQDNFLTLKGSRYYFTSLKRGAGNAVAHVLRLALSQGMVLGIPLSYGILYCIREGVVPDLDNMSLAQLIFLYWKDHDKCKESLTSIFDPYYWTGGGDPEDIQDASQVMGVLLDRTISVDDRLEWIRRYLFGYLFGTTKDGRLVRNKELKAFLSPLPNIWSEKLQSTMKTAALDNIADITGPSVDSDSIYSLINGLKANPIIEGHMKRYLAESDTENLRKFLIFVTGAVDLTQPIKVGIFNRNKLPISHTCTRELEINRGYEDYDSFKKDFDLALHEEGFGFA
jgi:hypothetical protein